MNFPQQISSFDQISWPVRPVHLAIGMFDGVHRGHRTVIGAAQRAARASDGLSGVLTFWPHPSALFRPAEPTRLLQDGAAKSRMLLAMGIDFVVTFPFDQPFAAVKAEDFLPWLRSRVPHLAAVYVGDNFRFGRGRKGDLAALEASGRDHGVAVFHAPRLAHEGEVISSTRIRAMLVAGEMAGANRLLGEPYTAAGPVTAGKRLGRSIGFPTLNIPWTPSLTPRFGVYAVSVSGEKAPLGLPAVANFGLRPTVENSLVPRLEAHILGPCPFVEGDQISVAWHHFLRPELKFSGVAELRGAIDSDRLAALRHFRL